MLTDKRRFCLTTATILLPIPSETIKKAVTEKTNAYSKICIMNLN